MAKLDTYTRNSYVGSQIKRLACTDTVVNLLDYSVVGDGTTDDTTNFQSAITASYGKILFVPPGTYAVTALTGTAGLTMIGVRGQSTIKVHSSKPTGTTSLLTFASANMPTRSVTNLWIEGITFDGASKTPQRWLQAGPSGATITDPQNDYYVINPAGKIGNPANPGYTIDNLVADNRRNSTYTSVFSLLDLLGTENATVTGCTFKTHYGTAILERGGLNVVIEDNFFDTIGKNDGAYPAIYTQCFGTPGGGQSFYQDSENIIIRNNRARNLERSFCLFAPTKGGRIENNYIDGWGESCIFANVNLHYNGGTSVIAGNTMKNGTITDIICCGIELNNDTDVRIENNTIDGSQTTAIYMPGSKRVSVVKNRFVNCCEDFSYPYGPFSERYAYSRGTSSIAGTAVTKNTIGIITVGTLGGVGQDTCMIAENYVYDNRSSPPYFIQQQKSGGNLLSKNTQIVRNHIDSTNAMTFLDTTIGTVWEANMSLWIKDNINHASEAPVIIDGQWTATGTQTITPGFRPSSVHAYAAANNAFVGRMATGAFTWNRAATRNDFALKIGADAAPANASVAATDILRLTDAAGTNKLVVEFVQWTETGFGINVVTWTENTNYRFVCYP